MFARGRGARVGRGYGRRGKVAREDLPVARAARGGGVRACLAEAEAVAEARAAEDVGRARARDLEARAFEHVPAERAADDYLEVPASYESTSLAFERDDFGAARVVSTHDAHGVEARAHVAALVRAQRAQKVRRVDNVSPLFGGRVASLVADAAQVRGRVCAAPELRGVGRLPAARGAEVDFGRVASRVAEDFARGL